MCALDMRNVDTPALSGKRVKLLKDISFFPLGERIRLVTLRLASFELTSHIIHHDLFARVT